MKRFAECTPVLWVLCVLVLGWPRMGWAEEDFEQGVDIVRQLFETQRYDEALERIEQLQPQAQSKEQKSALSLYEGLILASMGRRTQDRASAAFRSALQVDPQARLPEKVPPRLERIFEEQRARVRKEQAERPAQESPVEVPSTPLAPEPARTEASAVGELGMSDRFQLSSRLSSITASPAPAPVPVTATFRNKIRRPHVLVPALTGGALGISGGILWGLARREQTRLQKVDLGEQTLGDARLMAARGERYQDWALGTAVAGGVALGVATVLYVLQVPKPPVTLGTSGSSATLQGSWP